MRFDFATVLPRLIKNTDLTIVDSYSTMADLIAKFGVNKEKLTVVHLGVDTSFFYPRHDSSQVLDKYGVRHEFLLYVGTDILRKNLKTLVRAYTSICREIPHDLVLVGPISEKRLRTYINKSDIPSHERKEVQNRITLLGYVAYEDLPSIYSAATALILPSLYEGFGLPPLEAMACGTTAVVSNNSSLKEVVSNCGVIIKDPLDPEEISIRILEALEEGEQPSDLTRRGIERAREFTYERTIQKTIAAYDRVTQM
jgi:glycosyltransferase involved in cell wall biosynthesis